MVLPSYAGIDYARPPVKQHTLKLVVLFLVACSNNSQQVVDRDLQEPVDQTGDQSESDGGLDSLDGALEPDGEQTDEDLRDVDTDVCSDYLEPESRGNLPPELDEASGLTVSSFDPNLLWAHNDDASGDFDVFAFNPEGNLVASIGLDGVDFIDWEDMARAPCPGDDAIPCLYIGDIGDNLSVRESLVVYAFPEPDPRHGDAEIDDVLAMELTYPDGAHNSEALFVDSESRVYLLTKEANLSQLYAADFTDGVRVLEYVTTIEITSGAIRLVTAADLSSDGSRLLVRTYSDAFEYHLAGPISDALSETVPSIVPTAFEVQGEAIAYAPSGGYWHVSEGNEPTIFQVRCAE